MKKILHFSTFDHGGAGKAAYRLHRNFLSAGFQSKMAVFNKQEPDKDVFEIGTVSYTSRLYTFLSKVRLKFFSNQDYYFQNQSRSILKSTDVLMRSINYQPDLIILHWVSNFISLDDIKQISQAYRVPVIWYILDMAPLTGGCHYAWDCTGYYRECGMCPALKSTNMHDLSRRVWQEKHLALKKIDLDVVAGSGWLEKQARNSSLFHDQNITKILLSVDPDIFVSIPKAVARKKLGLSEGKKIIFFGNQGLGLKRKGMSHLFEALKQLVSDPTFDKNKVLVTVAGDTPNDLYMPLEYKSLGFLGSDEMLALAYQAADVFVCPSVEDSGPMMINESIMCGTPVVSFDMGVAPDLVKTGLTGYRAKLGDSEDLAHGIKTILNLSSGDINRMSITCRDLGMSLCHPKRQLEGFNKLIEQKYNTYLQDKD